MAEATTLTKAALSRHLREMKDNTSVGKLNPVDAGVYAYYLERLRKNTDGALTETEYAHLARMELFLEEYERHVQDRGIANVDAMLIDTARKFREKILTVLQKSREGNQQPTPFLIGLKEYSAQLDQDKTLVKIKFVEMEEK